MRKEIFYNAVISWTSPPVSVVDADLEVFHMLIFTSKDDITIKIIKHFITAFLNCMFQMAALNTVSLSSSSGHCHQGCGRGCRRQGRGRGVCRQGHHRQAAVSMFGKGGDDLSHLPTPRHRPSPQHRNNFF